ncbi:MAG: tRNA (N6-threonylcarbamoyladenosine(37)-N6)-methyltransferase TrmO, partial [Candidatus Bathyarchaeota archaeon]|nr:tRNA (N6-threonylcarbamoyladenosine(37)-N6)-methyltransferase TrmO [Candidatus Bathyarchaeota archaeon]
MMEILYRPIGVIKTPFKTPKGTPIQPMGAVGVEGQVILDSEYLDGLKDLEGFSHLF